MPDANSILAESAQRTEAALRALLADLDAPPRLREAMAYSLMAGGKRLRPTLVWECAQLVGGMQGQWQEQAVVCGVAIELIHTFSLIHDDLPAMDDDDLRRGKPTCHKVFGEALAILAGDAMVALAFEVLSDPKLPHSHPLLPRELARATGPSGMIGGQVLDIEAESKRLSLQDLHNVHARKTGALITAACRMGALCASAGPTQLNSITLYGQHLGLAFQIVDDILDETSTPQELGKATGKDANKGKNTYPALLGLPGSVARAQAEIQSAVNAISSFGSAADRLTTLARFVIARTC